MEMKEVNGYFGYHKLTEGQLKRVEAARGDFAYLLHRLDMFTKNHGREFSVVKTKLQEASMWFNKAVSLETPEQANG